MIEIHFGGHLNFYAPGKKSRITYPLTSPINLETLLNQFQIPMGEVALVVINGEASDRLNVEVNPGDCIDLYSPMSGG